MPKPLVTIVTPSYNQGPFIRATIESVLSQDYQSIEYIIMDGGSTDETASVVKDYSSRVTWISEPDRGQSHAINKGFRMAKGSIVSWLNSDDRILPGAVRHAVSGFAANPRCGAVYGEGYLMDRAGNLTGKFPCTEPLDLWKLVYLSDYILQQTVYFRRTALEESGYLREDLHYAMDWEILIRLAKRYGLHYIPEYMGCLREYPEAKSFSGGRERVREIAALLREQTGMRYPPGYVVYGLESYQKIWCDVIETRSPRWLHPISRRFQTLVKLACGLCIERTIRDAQGWYADRWAGPHLRYMLPARADGFLKLSGGIPQPEPLRLTMLAGAQRIASKTFEPGEFEWTVPIEPASGADALHLSILASRWFSNGIRHWRHWRRLSYFLRSVEFEPRRKFPKTPELEIAHAARS